MSGSGAFSILFFLFFLCVSFFFHHFHFLLLGRGTVRCAVGRAVGALDTLRKSLAVILLAVICLCLCQVLAGLVHGLFPPDGSILAESDFDPIHDLFGRGMVLQDAHRLADRDDMGLLEFHDESLDLIVQLARMTDAGGKESRRDLASRSSDLPEFGVFGDPKDDSRSFLPPFGLTFAFFGAGGGWRSRSKPRFMPMVARTSSRSLIFEMTWPPSLVVSASVGRLSPAVKTTSVILVFLFLKKL